MAFTWCASSDRWPLLTGALGEEVPGCASAQQAGSRGLISGVCHGRAGAEGGARLEHGIWLAHFPLPLLPPMCSGSRHGGDWSEG